MIFDKIKSKGHYFCFNLATQDEVKRMKPNESNQAFYQNTLASQHTCQSWYGLKMAQRRGYSYMMPLREVLKVLDCGMADNLKEYAKLKERLKSKLDDAVIRAPRRSKRIVRGMAGDEIDIQRVFNGDLNRAWRHGEPAPRVQKTNTVAIAFRVNFDRYTVARSIRYLPVIAGFVAEHLIASGINPAVYYMGNVAVSSSGEGCNYACTYEVVPVKEMSEPLHIVKLLTMLSVTYFRSYGFLFRICNGTADFLEGQISPALGVTLRQRIPEKFRKHMAPPGCGKLIDVVIAAGAKDEHIAAHITKEILEKINQESKRIDDDDASAEYHQIK